MRRAPTRTHAPHRARGPPHSAASSARCIGTGCTHLLHTYLTPRVSGSPACSDASCTAIAKGSAHGRRTLTKNSAAPASGTTGAARGVRRGKAVRPPSKSSPPLR
eukprot:TRINITY_DN1266_c0_g1_i1.p2 TRINITY_DN1266_c0_g1~~TRINITY_DN1266_c0_g1_i1.p2  ORF type:complete len:105 (-),score=8.01 TRINITY_DN1266_c0_g1_i1:643-957(-)